MSPYFKGVMIGICIAVLLAWSTISDAWDLDVSAGMMSYQESSADPAFSLEVRGGIDAVPGYLVLGYETPKITFLGQSLGDAQIATVGYGFSFKQTKKLSWFTEIGYGEVVQWESKHNIQQEVVFTELVRKHHVPNRPIPLNLTGPYDTTSYKTSYALGGGPYGRLGVRFDITDHINARLSWRYLVITEEYDMWDEDRRGGKYNGGWWQDRTTLDLSAWTFTIGANF